MAFQIRRISDVGTSNPIVARLGLQTSELLRWIELDEVKKEAIAELYIRPLTQRLLRCEKAAETIKEKLGEDVQRIKGNVADDHRMLEIPYVIGLEGHVQDFLYEAKNYLRDLLGVFQHGYGCALTEAGVFTNPKASGDSKLVAWAIATFGPTDNLVNLLRSDQEWITELIRKRNAVEHPGDKSGTLTVHNVRVLNTQQGLVPPSWARTSEHEAIPESDIVTDMSTYVSNLLGLAEDLLADMVDRTKPFKQLQIYEIADGDRNAECPVRFHVSLTQDLLMRLGKD